MPAPIAHAALADQKSRAPLDVVLAARKGVAAT
jgi:hypothetical protein